MSAADLSRQLIQRIRELENELIQWGERAEWALMQDDPDWWVDPLEGLVKRSKQLKDAGVTA